MNISELWKRGLSLEEALFEFSDKKTIDRYWELAESQPMARAISALAEGIKNNPNAFERSSKASMELSEQTGLKNELKTNLIGELTIGTLIGLGYSLPRAIKDQPTEIPKDVWHGTPDWKQSTIRGSGLEFVSVRLIHKQWIDEIAAELVSTGDIRRPGRRSRRPQIREAINALDEAGKIHKSESARSHFPLILDWVRTRYPDDPDGDKGLGEKVLYSEFAAFFKKGKIL